MEGCRLCGKSCAAGETVIVEGKAISGLCKECAANIKKIVSDETAIGVRRISAAPIEAYLSLSSSALSAEEKEILKRAIASIKKSTAPKHYSKRISFSPGSDHCARRAGILTKFIVIFCTVLPIIAGFVTAIAIDEPGIIPIFVLGGFVGYLIGQLIVIFINVFIEMGINLAELVRLKTEEKDGK